jgi:uncharacterized protein (DUF3084 family)
MSSIAKVFTVLNLVFSLIVVGTIGAFLSKSEDYKGKLEKERVDHEATRATKDAIIAKETGDKANFESQNRTLTNQLSDRTTELAAANASIEQLRNDNNELRGSVTGAQTSLKNLETRIADVDARNKELMDSEAAARAASAQAEKDKLDAQDDRARIEGDLKRANEDIAAKEAQIAALNEQYGNLSAERAALVSAGVDIPAIVGNAVKEINGKVSSVGADFVVLSVGATEQVTVGTPFHVYRGNDYIGRVIVDDVLPDSATARVTLRNTRGLKFMAGDVATTRL